MRWCVWAGRTHLANWALSTVSTDPQLSTTSTSPPARPVSGPHTPHTPHTHTHALTHSHILVLSLTLSLSLTHTHIHTFSCSNWEGELCVLSKVQPLGRQTGQPVYWTAHYITHTHTHTHTATGVLSDPRQWSPSLLCHPQDG